MLLLLRSLLDGAAVQPPKAPPAGNVRQRRPMLWLPYQPQPHPPAPQGRARKRRQQDILFLGA
jgi:hypothetical protein